MGISIVLPAYREEENLKTILPNIKDSFTDKDISYEIIVVDTKEALDATQEVCEANGVRWVQRGPENTYGDAIRSGIQAAKEEYMVVMDADGSHEPSNILKFYDTLRQEQADLVIGSRYVKGGKTDNNFILIFMSRVLNLSYRLFFGLKVCDVSDSFRLYKTEQIKGLKLECDNFDIVEEILIKLNQINNFKIVEVPITFYKRKEGESKRDLLKFIKSYISTMIRLKKICKK